MNTNWPQIKPAKDAPGALSEGELRVLDDVERVIATTRVWSVRLCTNDLATICAALRARINVPPALPAKATEGMVTAGVKKWLVMPSITGKDGISVTSHCRQIINAALAAAPRQPDSDLARLIAAIDIDKDGMTVDECIAAMPDLHHASNMLGRAMERDEEIMRLEDEIERMRKAAPRPDLGDVHREAERVFGDRLSQVSFVPVNAAFPVQVCWNGPETQIAIHAKDFADAIAKIKAAEKGQ